MFNSIGWNLLFHSILFILCEFYFKFIEILPFFHWKVEIKHEVEIGVDGDEKLEVGSNVEIQHHQQPQTHELKIGEMKMEEIKVEEVPQHVIMVTQHSPQQPTPTSQTQKVVVIPPVASALQTTVITTPRPRMITTAGHIR